jgi:hypothetical protein
MRSRFFSAVIAVIALLPLSAAVRGQTMSPIPSDSKMAAANPAWQRVLLNSMQTGAIVDPDGCWQMIAPLSHPAPADVTPKFGSTAVMLFGAAQTPSAKGDFKLTPWYPLPGKPQMIGAWIYLAPDANVAEVGLEVADSGSAVLGAMRSADWTGWKWVEADLTSGDFTDTRTNSTNKNIVLPVRAVHVAWRSKQAGNTSIIVNGLCGITDSSGGAPAHAIDAAFVGPAYTAANVPLNSMLCLTNYGGQTVQASVDFSVQHDGAMYDRVPPDPVYGSDRALGAKSWTEADGKEIEDGSLTDGKPWTYAETPQIGHHWLESFQYIDLGKPLNIKRMSWDSGDAGRLVQVDVSSSMDGNDYTPIDGLQNFVLTKKWGLNNFPLGAPFTARFLRFHYHGTGAKLNGIRMPEEISVYDGIANDSQSLPTVGRVAASGTLSVEIPAHAFVVEPIASSDKLAAGAYLTAVKVRGSAAACFAWNHLIVMPDPIAISADSRFGLNVASPQTAESVQSLGVGWVRFENMKWPFVSPTQGVYDYHGDFGAHVDVDTIFQTYQQHGLNVLPFLFLFPGYLFPPGVQPNSVLPADVSRFGEFAYQTAARYGATKHPPEDLKTADKKSGLGLIHVFEIWNEENQQDFSRWSGPGKYYEMFRAAAEAVKRADPTALITNGGFSGIGVRLFDELRTRYPDGKCPLDFVDVLNAHYYTGQSPPETCTLNANTGTFGSVDTRTFEQNLRLLSDWRDRYKPKAPIWLTETGYETNYIYFVDERTQAAWLVRDLMLCLANGVDKAMVFRETGSDNFRWGGAGVMRTDGTPKPSYFSYATLIRQFDGVKGAGKRLDVGDDNIRIYAWKKGTDTLVTAWTIGGTAAFPLHLGSADLVDAFGDAQSSVDTSSLTLTEFPIYLRNLSDVGSLQVAIAKADRAEAQRRALVQRQIALKAYLFGFGSSTDVGGTVVGEFRRYTPVIASDTWSEQKGYGFAPNAALRDDNLRRNDTNNQHDCRLAKGIQFRFLADPGNYVLNVGLLPDRVSVNLTVTGAVGGTQTIEVTGKTGEGQLNVEAAAGVPLAVEVDGYAGLRWVNLVQQMPGAQ